MSTRPISLAEAIRQLTALQRDLAEQPARAADVAAVLEHLRAGKTPRGFRRVFAERVLVVEGRGRCPLEMCERDRCAPLTETDALRMGDRGEARRIALRWFVPTAGTTPHVRRWQSFGWAVCWHGNVEDFGMKRQEVLGVKGRCDMANEGQVLRGEAAILYAEQINGRLRVTDVIGVRPETVRTMLALGTPRQREEIVADTTIEVVLPAGAA